MEERCDYTEDLPVSPLAPTHLCWSPLFTFSVALTGFWSLAQSKWSCNQGLCHSPIFACKCCSLGTAHQSSVCSEREFLKEQKENNFKRILSKLWFWRHSRQKYFNSSLVYLCDILVQTSQGLGPRREEAPLFAKLMDCFMAWWGRRQPKAQWIQLPGKERALKPSSTTVIRKSRGVSWSEGEMPCQAEQRKVSVQSMRPGFRFWKQYYRTIYVLPMWLDYIQCFFVCLFCFSVAPFMFSNIYITCKSDRQEAKVGSRVFSTLTKALPTALPG